MSLEEADGSFYKELYQFVKAHPATNNEFIDRFARGEISYE